LLLDGCAHIMQDTGTRQGQLLFRSESAPVAVAASPDGKLVAFADQRGAIRLLDVAKEAPGGSVQPRGGGPPVGQALRQWPARGDVKMLTFFPDGTRLAVLDGGKDVRILHVATGKEDAAFPGDVAVQALALSPDGERAATAGKGEVRLWDVASGKEQRRFTGPQGGAGLGFAAG